MRRSPGITLREAGREFGLSNATGLYGPMRALVEHELVFKDGSKLFPVIKAVSVQPGSWAERVLEQLAAEPGRTVYELNQVFGLEERSTTLYPAVRRLTAHGVVVKDGGRLYPVARDGVAIATV